MPAVLPVVAGVAGSFLLNKLAEAISNAGTTAQMEEGSSVGGAGRVYEAGSQPVMGEGVQPSHVIQSPNAQMQPTAVRQADGTIVITSPNAEGTQQPTNTAVDSDPAAAHKAAVIAETEGANATAAPAVDPASAPIDGNDLLNTLLAAAGGGAAVYGAKKMMSGGADATARVEPTVAAPAAKGTAVAAQGNKAVANPAAKPAASNVIDAEFTPVNDPLNLAAGDSTLALESPKQKLAAPNNVVQEAAQVEKIATAGALPAPKQSAINMPDETSGPTIKQGSQVLDPKTAKKITLGGQTYQIQGNNVFDKAGKFIGEASKIFPGNMHGTLRTLGIMKRM